MGIQKIIKTIHFQNLTGIKNLNILLLVMFLWLSFTPLLILCQSNEKEFPLKQLKIQKAQSRIKLDGLLDEQDWKIADKAINFIQNFPSDTDFALTTTEVAMTYDDKNIYLSAKCMDPIEGPYIIQSLKRDFSFPVSDAFALFLSPYNDSRNGFSFSLNPLGVQREGTLTNGGTYGVTTAWDNKWFGKVNNEDKYWTLEMSIPFKSIRYNSDVSEWQVNFARNDQKQNEMSTWGRVPINFNVAAIPFSGKLIWDKAPPKAGMNYALIPYTFGSLFQDHQNNINEYSLNAGLDAKLAVTSSLNLDLTINPDYSQVEVDKQVLNLSRYSIYFPEKRYFFIENSDLFSQFGFRNIRPFFSRKIGLLNGQQVPIIAGARLSGNLNNNWRIGMMNMLTNEMPELNLTPQNYSVAAAQRKIFSGSNLGFIMVNRQGVNKAENTSSDYNRILGMDFNFASKDNSWVGKLFYHQSFDHEKLNESYSHASYLQYRSRSLFVMWNHEYVGKNYIADVGFVPRLYNYDQSRDTSIRQSFWRLEPDIAYGFYPKNSFIFKHGPQLYLDYYADSSFHLADRRIRFGYLFEFMNQSEIYFTRNIRRIKLFFPIDITGQGATPLPAGMYNTELWGVRYKSNKRKRFYGETDLKLGSFYNGQITTYGLSLSYRKQPWGIFSMDFKYHNVRLPEPYNSTELILFGPKFEISFTKSLFLNTFFQYNTQIDNININTRLQWRFKPMSDLYFVYTDNYDVYFNEKNRAFVLKFVYWLSP